MFRPCGDTYLITRCDALPRKLSVVTRGGYYSISRRDTLPRKPKATDMYIDEALDASCNLGDGSASATTGVDGWSVI